MLLDWQSAVALSGQEFSVTDLLTVAHCGVVDQVEETIRQLPTSEGLAYLSRVIVAQRAGATETERGLLDTPPMVTGVIQNALVDAAMRPRTVFDPAVLSDKARLAYAQLERVIGEGNL